MSREWAASVVFRRWRRSPGRNAFRIFRKSSLQFSGLPLSDHGGPSLIVPWENATGGARCIYVIHVCHDLGQIDRASGCRIWTPRWQQRTFPLPEKPSHRHNAGWIWGLAFSADIRDPRMSCGWARLDSVDKLANLKTALRARTLPGSPFIANTHPHSLSDDWSSRPAGFADLPFGGPTRPTYGMRLGEIGQRR